MNNNQNNELITKNSKINSITQINKISIATRIDFQEHFSSLAKERSKRQSEDSIYVYDSCPIKLFGREKELELLNLFLNDNRCLLWWAITGLPGSGKSRLAYDFMTELNNDNNWIARFVPYSEFDRDCDKYNFSTINKNFLFIVDYMYAYEEQIAQWIERLSNQFPAKYKLRILVIEREYSNNIKLDPWEQFFMNGFVSPDCYYGMKFKENNLNLNSYLLSENECKEIIKSFCETKRLSISDFEIDLIFTLAVKSNNNKPSALLLMIFTEYYLYDNKSGFSANPYKKALSRVANRELEFIYKTIGVKNSIDKLLVEKVIIVATILGKIELDVDFNFLLEILSLEKNDLKELLDKFSKSKLIFIDNDKKSSIIGVVPDLIGEYIVFDYFENMNIDISKKFLDLINCHNQKRFLSFLSRFIVDQKEMLKTCNKIDLFSNYLSEDRSMIFEVINDQGFTVECEVLFTFESDENKKNYIVYTDNTLDEEGNTKVYASIYDSNQDATKLLPIETEKEWKVIEVILQDLQEECNSEEIGLEEQMKRIDAKIAELENKSDRDDKE